MADLSLDLYLVDVLMPDLVGHDHSASGFLVYLYLWRHSQGRGRATVEASYQTIASDVGLSKTAVQTAIRRLQCRRLVSAERRHATATPVYRVLRPWQSRPIGEAGAAPGKP
ncbi:MAG: helix-turn-helix domain-containing protein [Rhodanobacteraceae bacterium]